MTYKDTRGNVATLCPICGEEIQFSCTIRTFIDHAEPILDKEGDNIHEACKDA